MNKITLILVLLIFTTHLNAQDSAATSFGLNKKRDNNFDSNLLFLCRENVEKEIPLNSFLNSNWKNSEIINSKGESYSIQSRYLVSEDEIQILLNGRVKILYPQKVQSIKIEDKTFAGFEFETKENISFGVFEVLVSGKMSLLKKYEYYNEKISTQLYFKNENRKFAQKIKGKKKLFQSIKDKRVDDFCKKNNINFSNEEDLIEFFNFYLKLS